MDDAYHVLASLLRDRATPDPLLFVLQSVLLATDEHARHSADTGALGLLLGHRFRCSRTGVTYEVAERALPLAATDEVDDVPLGEKVREAMRAELAAGGSIVGWYARRPQVGTRVSRIDEEAHRTVFPEAWQAMLALDPDPAVPTGAFFLYSGKAERSYQIPFHELIAERDMPVKGQSKQSVMRWCNYGTPEVIVPAGRAERERLIAPDVEGGEARSPVERMIAQLRGWMEGNAR
jgi:hypothetical protein